MRRLGWRIGLAERRYALGDIRSQRRDARGVCLIEQEVVVTCLHEALRRRARVERIFADAGYQGLKMAKVVADTGCWTLQIVKRSGAHDFVVLPRRWIVERTIAWIRRNRRLARDFERYAKTVAAFVRLAMIRIMLRRLTRSSL